MEGMAPRGGAADAELSPRISATAVSGTLIGDPGSVGRAIGAASPGGAEAGAGVRWGWTAP